MSSGKLLSLWALTLCFHISSTVPTPIPPKEKYSPIIKNPSIWEGMVFANPVQIVVKSGLWLVAIVETFVIVASKAPQLAVSQLILEILFTNKNPDQLRILPAQAVGLELTLIGCFLRIYCFRTMGRFFTFEKMIKVDHQLITSGPYGIVRHPAYSSYLFQFPGVVLWYLSKGSVLRESGFLDTQFGRSMVMAWVLLRLVTNVLLLRGMPFEDAALRKKFGKEWEEWAQQVPYWLIPGII